MPVKVIHRSTDFNATMAKTTLLQSSSWTIVDGHLTVGDFSGSPEASFAPEAWFDVYKVVEEGDESEES